MRGGIPKQRLHVGMTVDDSRGRGVDGGEAVQGRLHFQRFIARQQDKIVRAIANCRTADVLELFNLFWACGDNELAASFVRDVPGLTVFVK